MAEDLALELVAVAAEPFAVSRSVLGTDSNGSFTAILADVGGGTTDIAVVNDGGVEGTRMFGIGGRSFTRTIMTDMDLNYSDAEKLKLHVNHEQIKPTVKKQLDGLQSRRRSKFGWLASSLRSANSTPSIIYRVEYFSVAAVQVSDSSSRRCLVVNGTRIAIYEEADRSPYQAIGSHGYY